MKTLALIAQKGGAGKTTLAINLAIAASRARLQTVLIDIDPQESSHKWSLLREHDNPAIIKPPQGQSLTNVLQTAADVGAQLTIIDTAPHSTHAAEAAAQQADLVLMPVKPSNLDLDAIGDTVDILRRAGTRSLFVLNDCKPTSTLTQEAMEALSVYGPDVANVQVGSRVAFISSLKYGQGVLEFEPKGKGADEMRKLWKIVKKQLGI